jgi:hypothetical protein
MERNVIVFTAACHWTLSHTFMSYFFKIHLNIILQGKYRSQNWFLFFSTPTKFFVVLQFLPQLLHEPLNSSSYDLITLVILGKEYKTWGSSLCSFLQLPVISFLFKFKYSLQNSVIRHLQSTFPSTHRPTYTS